MKSAMIAGVVVIGLAAFLSSGRAQSGIGNVHEMHFLTFAAPIALPDGMTLPAGTYLFSWNQEQGVTRISSEDRSKVYATLQAIPVQRRDVRQHDIVIERTATNTPPMLKAWFCPGNPTGHQFVTGKK